MEILNSSVIPAGELTATMRREMADLYLASYDGSSVALFEADLADKDHILLLRDTHSHIVGFTTLALIRTEQAGTPIRAVFSGDTVIDRRHWGRQDLAFTWIRFTGTLKAEEPEVPLYWFLIVKGHRTYRYLSAFSIDFVPTWRGQGDKLLRSVLNRLASDRFGISYNALTGLIRFDASRGHLRRELAEISDAERLRPDIACFLSHNPDYVEGVELACLTELSAANLRPIAKRQFLAGYHLDRSTYATP